MAEDTYDYVIVGAGSAGAVLAARLSEDPGVSVLLLEAGGEADADEINIPAGFPSLFKTKRDWNYETTEQKQLNGRRTYWPRMKALGGCSSMNAMIYIRGNPLDFDTFRDQYGAAGWGYDDVLPYFLRSEDNTRLSGPFHAQGGPLRVEDRVYTHPTSEAWVDSAVSGGLKRTDDFNGASQEGAGQYQVTCRKGRRWSTEKAFLAPARSRANLTVTTGAMASRIEIEGDRATGVTFRQAGGEHTVHARREVIVSGGAINSPQLLLLSGIGPRAQLAEVGVESRVDLPGVGANLQDHPVVPLIWLTKGTTDLAELNNMRNFGRWKARDTFLAFGDTGRMDAAKWDERYAATEMVWSAEPNRFVAEELAELPPGRALDLAAGEGRNAIWLARRGWDVTAVDYSQVAVDKGRRLAGDTGLRWVCADVTGWDEPASYDLVVMAYLQVPAADRRAAIRAGGRALRPGGTFFLVAHDSRNLTDGVGGPQDPAVLYTAQDVLDDLAGLELETLRADFVERPTDDGVALDALVRLVRP